MKSTGRSLAVAAVLAAALPLAVDEARGHHGGGIEWNRDLEGPVTGTATEFAFRFPHVQLFVDVPDAEGNVDNWVFVTRWTPTVLRGWGWSRNSIRPGDELTLTYATHVERPNTGNMVSIDVNGEPLPLSEDEAAE